MDSISYPEFSRIYNGLQKESNQLYRLLSKHYGISDSECWILYVLREEGRPLTQTELCNTLYLSKQTVNSALKSLEADGYIRLECASGNRRSKNIHLTEAGLALAMRTVDNVFNGGTGFSSSFGIRARRDPFPWAKTPEPAARGGMQAFIRKIFWRITFMQIRLSDHFSYRKLLRFTLPSIVMMIVASIYSVVDGLFVSNLVGDLALSAVNIIFPATMIIGAAGFMLGTGGSAIVARTLGEGDHELANRYFSMIIYSVIILGVILSVACAIFIEPIARLSGASDLLMDDCIAYGRIMMLGSAAFMLQVSFQSFLVVAEKPHMGLVLSISAGLTNMVLDYVFIAVFEMGVVGAALATVAGYCVGGLIPLVYFFRASPDRLCLSKTQFYPKEFLHTCTNGSSELMSNISASIVGILFNIQLMRIIGEAGVAAHSVMMYVDFVFIAAFLGFSVGSAPIVSYHYGAANHSELKNVFRKSITIIAVTSVVMVLISELLSRPLSFAFVGYDAALLDMTVHGFRLFALCYFFCGINIYASAFFTALSNGIISAFISFMRSLVLRGGLVLLMPIWLGLDGVWTSVIAAEALGACIAVCFFMMQRHKYHYL